MASVFEGVNIPLLDPNAHDPHIDEKDIEQGVAPHSKHSKTRLLLTKCGPYLSFGFNLAVWFFIIASNEPNTHRIPWRGVSAVYSPPRDTIDHINVRFLGLTGRSIYHGPPSDAVDNAWEELYRYGISAIDKNQASQLDNETLSFSQLGGKYMIQLDVFHVLHCLNTVRKAVWPERYPLVNEQRYKNISGLVFDHVDHCINNIRESILCTADVTPNAWQVNEHPAVGLPRPQVQFDTLHSCTNFDALQEWAKKVHAPWKFSDAHNSHGDLVLDDDIIDASARKGAGRASGHHRHHEDR